MYIISSMISWTNLRAGASIKYTLAYAERKDSKSVCSSTQSDQSLRSFPGGMLDPWRPIQRQSKTLIRLRKCAVWHECSMDACANVSPPLDSNLFFDVTVYAGSKNMLTHLKYNWLDTLKKGFVVGWGHKTELSMDLPEEILRQNRRTAHTNKRCRKIYPELDTNKFFCVGNRKER